MDEALHAPTADRLRAGICRRDRCGGLTDDCSARGLRVTASRSRALGPSLRLQGRLPPGRPPENDECRPPAESVCPLIAADDC
jgi:hypothetical protein